MKSFPEACQASVAAPTVILFTSATCAPCKAMKPVLQRLADELQFPYVELDVMEHKEHAKALDIRAVPTLMVLRGGQVTGVFAGRRTPAGIREILHEEGVTQLQLPL